MTDTVQAVLAELAQLEDPRVRAVNERHGDDHGVNLAKLRALAKRVGKRQVLALELWDAGDTAGQLVATLIGRPREFEAAQLDRMLRTARAPKSQDWLVNYVVKKSPHAEPLRDAWVEDADPVVAGAGWNMTADSIAKGQGSFDEPGLLDVIEERMADAHERLQWGMNSTLAQIGIARPELRERAIAIGERLEVLKDYPTPAGCTSPYAPLWIAEMVRRQG